MPFAAMALLLSLSSIAHAQQPSAADKETARSLMTQGETQRARSDLKGALQSFQGADAIMKVPSTGLEVARAHLALGNLLEAREAALGVTRLPVLPGEPAPFTDARAKALALSDDLESRIPSVQIALKNLPEGATPTVTVDGATLPTAALDLPRKVNPGHHVITAHAGTSDGRVEVDVRERETKPVAVELAAPVVAVVAPPPPPEEKKNHTLTYVAFGVGAAGIVVGSITGLMSISKTGTLKDQCPDNKCPGATYDSQQFQDDKSSAESMGTISTVAFIVGGAGVAVGVVSLFLGGKVAATTGKLTPTVTPWVGAGSAGLRGSF
ncbi:MAG: hypothetical protein ABIP89_19515 [Polyangiaceae bacterium]